MIRAILPFAGQFSGTCETNSREHGRLRARDVEVALGRLVPHEGTDYQGLAHLNTARIHHASRRSSTRRVTLDIDSSGRAPAG